MLRRTPFRAAAGVSKLAGMETCSRCTQPARFLTWCRSHAEEEADRRVARFVRRRDGRCVVVECGESQPWLLEWAHILPRARYKRLRWQPLNTVTLCIADHRYLDTHPKEKRAFFRDRFPGLLEDLDVLKDRAPRPDLLEILNTYRGAA